MGMEENAKQAMADTWDPGADPIDLIDQLWDTIVQSVKEDGYHIAPQTTDQVTFRCDGCGRLEPGTFNRMGDALKPSRWYQRSDDDGSQLACSRACIDKIAEASGKTRVVRPI